MVVTSIDMWPLVHNPTNAVRFCLCNPNKSTKDICFKDKKQYKYFQSLETFFSSHSREFVNSYFQHYSVKCQALLMSHEIKINLNEKRRLYSCKYWPFWYFHSTYTTMRAHNVQTKKQKLRLWHFHSVFLQRNSECSREDVSIPNL